MAGEIQLNSVSFASESSGTITVNNGTIGTSVLFPAGHVITFGLAHNATSKTVTAASYGADSSTLTSVAVTISKKISGSSILILCSANLNGESTGGTEARGGARIVRGSGSYTEIKDFDGVVMSNDAAGNQNHQSGGALFLQCVDTTTSTGSLTYTLEVKKIVGIDVKVNSGGSFSSSISALEITT